MERSIRSRLADNAFGLSHNYAKRSQAYEALMAEERQRIKEIQAEIEALKGQIATTPSGESQDIQCKLLSNLEHQQKLVERGLSDIQELYKEFKESHKHFIKAGMIKEPSVKTYSDSQAVIYSVEYVDTNLKEDGNSIDKARESNPKLAEKYDLIQSMAPSVDVRFGLLDGKPALLVNREDMPRVKEFLEQQKQEHQESRSIGRTPPQWTQQGRAKNEQAEEADYSSSRSFSPSPS